MAQGANSPEQAGQQASRPDINSLRAELNRESRKRAYSNTVGGITFIVVIVIGAVILISGFFISILKITGESMAPTVQSGQIVLLRKHAAFGTGDLVAFHYSNRVLVKRVIAGPGDWVDIDAAGHVSVNGEQLNELYTSDLCLTPTDMVFPYQVPENRYFVLGDHRSISIDSRSSAVGCISPEQMIGKVVFRLYPFHSFGKIRR